MRGPCEFLEQRCHVCSYAGHNSRLGSWVPAQYLHRFRLSFEGADAVGSERSERAVCECWSAWTCSFAVVARKCWPADLLALPSALRKIKSLIYRSL